VQAREWYLPNWLKAEDLAVPRDDVPLRGYPHLAGFAVPD
jgi:hypothetical protein